MRKSTKFVSIFPVFDLEPRKLFLGLNPDFSGFWPKKSIICFQQFFGQLFCLFWPKIKFKVKNWENLELFRNSQVFAKCMKSPIFSKLPSDRLHHQHGELSKFRKKRCVSLTKYNNILKNKKIASKKSLTPPPCPLKYWDHENILGI